MTKKTKGVVPWCVMGAGFAVWFAAMAAMAALPTTPSHPQGHEGGPRASAVTGLLVLHQDPRTQQTVPLRDLRPY
ncbi:MAG: hypothetical protein JNM30_18980 [Rhodospirillales bacterium]|nr:hypothetical protein [Rhodospirillales bacterium]